MTLAVALPQHLPREAWSVQADATRLRQVLVNVIGNAIKYNLENGRVDIAVHLRAPRLTHARTRTRARTIRAAWSSRSPIRAGA